MSAISEIHSLVWAGLQTHPFLAGKHMVTRQTPKGVDAVEFRWVDGLCYKIVISEAEALGASIEDDPTDGPWSGSRR